MDMKNTHTNQTSTEKHNGKKILIVLFTCAFISVLVFLSIMATKYRWFEKESNSFSISDDSRSARDILEYDGVDTVVLNNNRPDFTEYDLQNITGENYSDLDSLGRCGAAVALLDYSMMPTEPRGEIGDVRPSGWRQEKYPGVVNSEPPYLYNRCHLIAYMFTGQNANEKNLITGTRYFNTELMLPIENRVAQYLYGEDTPDFHGNYKHVLYRVTPHFKDNELVARGVEIEALSVEDNGEALSIHVFIYNIQPGIVINYETGESCEE